jgi:hypothetical protein
MNIDGIVTQLETVTGLSGKVVVGLPPQTDSLSSGPKVWITDIAETASPSGRINQPSIQKVDCRIGIVTSGADLTEILPLRDGIRTTLIDYQPETQASGDPLSYRAGRMEFLDAGYVVWRDEFSYTYYVDLLNT